MWFELTTYHQIMRKKSILAPTDWLVIQWNGADSVARWLVDIFQYLAIYNSANLPKSIKVKLKILQNTN